ncbi:DUF1501 domain-containing protein [Paracoccus sp. JM45]|uniref:DUF1501 domain-containing protein n=1 Tax=Paracoccus sp. JM45 TaxID=2283626 RepID=UPI000E6BCA24|nr:DUF1501 domain-containing protein [Paracoccus sp. JM45]RJE81546.1 DUF1501 domain-containing protein [Paracoccus sp. JM45]
MLTRRLFLKSTALIGCSAAASPLMSSAAFASAPGENRLVVIILRGAMDGIDAFQPYGDRNLADLRKTLSLGPDHGATDLDGFFALHPGLSDLMPLWQAGQMAFAPAVSTPYRDKRSHFDGQNMLEAGTGTDLHLDDQQDGWLNRMLQAMPGQTSETAYSVGVEKMLILQGAAKAKSWTPDATLALSSQAERLLMRMYHDDPLFREASEQALEIVSGLQTGPDPDKPQEEHIELARFAADRLNRDTRIASFSMAGWDTHSGQAGSLKRNLGRLADTILTLKQDLGRNWDTTTVMAMTEFGRTARENGAAGTDHGTGGAMLVAGGAVRGGQVMGEWPGLGESDLYDGRDLMPLRDIRAYAAWAMHAKFGIDKTLLEGSIFPDLDMGSDPRMLA